MITGLHHVAISAVNFERSFEFYRDHFGLAVAFEWEFADGRGLNPLPSAPDNGPMMDIITGLKGCAGRQCMLRAPNSHIELFEWTAPTPARRDPEWRLFDHGINHVCFQVDDLDQWHRRLSAAGVQFTSEPQTFGAVKNVYALDPDGNLIELIEPLEAGARFELPTPAGPEFDATTTVEGVHHVGMSVVDFEQSMRFYETSYGLSRLGDGIDFSDGRFDTIWQTEGATGLAGFLTLDNAFIEIFNFTNPIPKRRDPNWTVADHGYTHFCFEMPDVVGAHEQLVAAGIGFNCPPFTQGRVIATYSHEVDGNLIELFQPLEVGRFLSIAP